MRIVVCSSVLILTASSRSNISHEFLVISTKSVVLVHVLNLLDSYPEPVRDVIRRKGRQLMVKIFYLPCQPLDLTVMWNHSKCTYKNIER